ncbi:PAT family beta-lactamase induction signal transducer AmpG [Halospina denitrificans]|uniref:PAT family beta-lactamase induction signal transducer AmpG n=1 Tax=Halospina denitrificans TaxID=332522 RepID=A0A4R7JXG7_9GAMM|nr:MFS transporter [Halospina denitrificans]TDT43170.1 PAT family beta-lactamase induction signal transducer AmpG [Halospina denitrificans]
MNEFSESTAYPGWRVYLNPRVLGMLFLGFSAGLPLLLVGGTFTAWLRDLNVELAAIGFLSWVGMAHSIKVLWAPFVDRLPLPVLSAIFGRRRAWMLAAQVAVAVSLLGMGLTDPREQLWLVAVWAVIAAFGSATQDVAIDAYRVEAAPSTYQAAMAATYVTGYRVAILVAGAGALHIAAVGSWALSYSLMGAFMVVGMITTLISREPVPNPDRVAPESEARVISYLADTAHTGFQRRLTAWFIGAVVCPFTDFFQRYGKAAIIILFFVSTFRISDIFMGVMANPFYLDLGFSKEEIANIAAAFGLAMTLFGAALGGLLVARFGIAAMLIFTAFMAPATNLTFAWLANLGPETYGLVAAIIADNVTGGLSISVFIAYLSSLTNTAYTATQYALFSSLMTLPGQFAGGFTGVVAERTGWVGFFLITAMLGLPAIILAVMLLRFAHPDTPKPTGSSDTAHN